MVDVSLFAPDCFHFSHWGHALMAKALWNNLFEPVGAKTSSFDVNDLRALCPPAVGILRGVLRVEEARCAGLSVHQDGRQQCRLRQDPLGRA